MSEIALAEGRKIESPYGKAPIIAWALFATWNLYINLTDLAAIPELEAIVQEIEEVARNAAPASDPEVQSVLASFRLCLTFWVINVAAWFAIVTLQYAFAYGLWKPKKWARKAGITSLGLGVVMSAAMLLTSIAINRSVCSLVGSEPEIPTAYIAAVVWNTFAFFAGWRFLNNPETRNYIESQG